MVDSQNHRRFAWCRSLWAMLDTTDDRCRVWFVSQWSRHGWLFVLAFLFSLMCFGIEVFSTSLSIDEGLHSVRTGPHEAWLSQDRWGMYLFNAILIPTPTLPFVSTLVGLLALSASSVVMVTLWSGSDDIRRGRLAALCLVGSPVLAFIVQFSTSVYGFFLGLLMGVSGLTLFVRGGPWRILTGLFLLVFAVSVYQSIGIAVLCAYLMYLLNRLVLGQKAEWDGPRTLGRAALFGVWFAGALVIHKTIASIVRHIFVPEGSYLLVDEFSTQGLWRAETWGLLANDLKGLVFGGDWYLGRVSGVLVAVCLCIVLMRLLAARRGASCVVFGLLTVAACLLTPFLLPVVSGKAWPTRTFLAVPVLIGGLVHAGMNVRWGGLRLLVGALACATLWWWLVSNNRLMYADQVRWRADVSLAVRLQERLAMAGYQEGSPTRLIVVGIPTLGLSPINLREETIGASIFEWDQGNPWRVAALLRVLGTRSIQGGGSRDDSRTALAWSESMPAWPADGSVVVKDGLAVVNFGPPGPQLIDRAK